MKSSEKLPWLICALSLIAAVYFYKQGQTPVESPADLTFTLKPRQMVSLAFANNADESRREIALQADAGDRVDILIRRGEGEDLLPLDELLSGVIGAESDVVEQPSILQNLVQEESPAQVFKFSWQDPRHPVLRQLRVQENLDSLLKGIRSEKEVFFTLQNWARNQWQPGSPSPYPDWNALVVLESIRSGKTGGFCGQYTQVLAQALQSYGFYCRYLWVKNHFAMEVYSPELSRWLVLDPFYNIVFRQKGELLNAWEVEREIRRDNGASLEVFDTAKKEVITDAALLATILNHYQHFDIDLKSDQLSSREGGLHFVNNHWRHSVTALGTSLRDRNFSGKVPLIFSNKKQVYFPLLNTEVIGMGKSGDELVLRLASTNPHPHPQGAFIFSSDEGKTWKATGEVLKIPKEPGKNYRVRSRSIMRLGAEMTFTIGQ